MQDNILYADSYRDLLVFDISNLDNIRFVKRFQDVMGCSVDDRGRWLGTPGGLTRDSLLVGYIERDTTYNHPCESPKGEDFVLYDNQALAFSSSSFKASAGSGAGKGGSMARFAIAKDHLYTIDQSRLHSYDISMPASPVKRPRPYRSAAASKPFSRTGITCTSAAPALCTSTTWVDPNAPARRSMVSHFRACDPVVVEGTTAYVTVRTGTFCQGNLNELQVYDVQDADRPVKLATYQMLNPHGLGIDNGRLFICEGGHGLRFMECAVAG